MRKSQHRNWKYNILFKRHENKKIDIPTPENARKRTNDLFKSTAAVPRFFYVHFQIINLQSACFIEFWYTIHMEFFYFNFKHFRWIRAGTQSKWCRHAFEFINLSVKFMINGWYLHGFSPNYTINSMNMNFLRNWKCVEKSQWFFFSFFVVFKCTRRYISSTFWNHFIWGAGAKNIPRINSSSLDSFIYLFMISTIQTILYEPRKFK